MHFPNGPITGCFHFSHHCLNLFHLHYLIYLWFPVSYSLLCLPHSCRLHIGVQFLNSFKFLREQRETFHVALQTLHDLCLHLYIQRPSGLTVIHSLYYTELLPQQREAKMCEIESSMTFSSFCLV